MLLAFAHRIRRWHFGDKMAREFLGPKLYEQSEKEAVTFSTERNPISLGKGSIAEVSRSGGVGDISCLEVIQELSNYIDDDVTPQLRAEILAHLCGCSRCAAVYNGLRNTITLTGDGRAFDLPAGFSQRLRAKLAKE